MFRGFGLGFRLELELRPFDLLLKAVEVENRSFQPLPGYFGFAGFGFKVLVLAFFLEFELRV